MQLLGTGTQRAGKTSRIGIAGDFLAFASWDINVRGEDLDTTNFESYNQLEDLSYSEGIQGVSFADIHGAGDWDAGAVPMGDPPGLFPRDDLATVNFYQDRNDPGQFDFPYMRVRSSKTATTVKGKVTFDFSGMNQGIFTVPSTNV